MCLLTFSIWLFSFAIWKQCRFVRSFISTPVSPIYSCLQFEQIKQYTRSFDLHVICEFLVKVSPFSVTYELFVITSLQNLHLLSVHFVNVFSSSDLLLVLLFLILWSRLTLRDNVRSKLKGPECKEHIRQNLKLFLDDGFIIHDENILEATQLLECLNKMDNSIQFTMETSQTELPFLDVMVKLETDLYNSNIRHVVTDIFYKPTDAFNYFPFNSCAPGHNSRNIPYNLARRIAMIVSNKKTRDKRLAELEPKLLAKKYPLNFIRDSIRNAKTYERDVLLNHNVEMETKDQTPNLTLVIDHNPNTKDPSNIIKNHCKNLIYTKKISSEEKKPPKIITARRQPPNLLRTLSLNVNRAHKIKNNNTNI